MLDRGNEAYNQALERENVPIYEKLTEVIKPD
jgi:hypothetical protein